MTRRIALLVNPTSGKGRGARLLEPVADRLRADGTEVDVVVGRDADEAFDRLRDRVAAGVDAVVAVGGDGLVNLALQVVAGTDAAARRRPRRHRQRLRPSPRAPAGPTRCAGGRTWRSAAAPARSTWVAPTAGGSAACSARASTRWSTSAPTG